MSLGRDVAGGEAARRTLATVATFLLTLAVNGAANALPLNGQTTAEISDRFHVFVIPAGYVFAIWGLIYLGLAAYTVYQARHADDPVVRRLGWLPAFSNLLNAAWIPLFHYELFALTVVVMVGLLVTLVAIHQRLWSVRHELTRATFWTVRVPFSIYLGWITVATVANAAQTLSASGSAVLGSPASAIAGDGAAGRVRDRGVVHLAFRRRRVRPRRSSGPSSASRSRKPTRRWFRRVAGAAAVGTGLVIAVRTFRGGQLQLRR